MKDRNLLEGSQVCFSNRWNGLRYRRSLCCPQTQTGDRWNHLSLRRMISAMASDIAGGSPELFQTELDDR